MSEHCRNPGFGRRTRATPAIALVVAVATGLTACGADDAGAPLPAPLDSAVPDSSVSGSESTVDANAQVFGTGNVGGLVIDPQPHPIDDIAIAESFPEQLIVSFTSADPNCTAADATATATGSTVIVTLEVGITEDALSRSCMAGDFENSVSITLDSGLDGREVIAAEL